MIESSSIKENRNQLNNSIKFSVIIPVYNAELYLTDCIHSVLKQTYQNFEIILINDGSTDSSGEICENFAKREKRIKIIHQTNQGHTAARKKGIEQSTGDYCLFLDSDDYWDSNLLETINQKIHKYECDLLLFKYKRVSNDGDIIYIQKSIFNNLSVFTDSNKIDILREIISGNDLNNLATKVVKRTNLLDINFDECKHIKTGEDLILSLPIIYKSKKILYIDSPMYNYRMVDKSITNTFRVKNINDITQVRKVVLNYMGKFGVSDYNDFVKFYNFFLNSFINYIYKLSVFYGINYSNKHKGLEDLHKNELYKESLKYQKEMNIRIDKKIILFLFQNRKYNVLIIFARLHKSLIDFVKAISKFKLF